VEIDVDIIMIKIIHRCFEKMSAFCGDLRESYNCWLVNAQSLMTNNFSLCSWYLWKSNLVFGRCRLLL